VSTLDDPLGSSEELDLDERLTGDGDIDWLPDIAEPQFQPPDVEPWGTFDQEAFTKGFVTAFIAAVRTRVPARLFLISGELSCDGRALDPAVHQRRLHRARLKYRNARRHRISSTKAEIEAKLAVDKSRFAYEARAAAKREQDAKRAYQALRAETTSPVGPEASRQFDAYAHLLVPAMARIYHCGGKVTQSEAHAFRQLVPNFAMSQRDGQWWAHAWVRMATTQGVAELGPIDWCVGSGGSGSQLFRARHGNKAVEAVSLRKTLRQQLNRTGISKRATATLTSASFAELPLVVLDQLTSCGLPDWVDEEWRQEAFAHWVAQVYSDANFPWGANSRFAYAAPVRQLVVYYAVDRGEFTTRQATDDLYLGTNQDIYRLVRPEVRRDTQTTRPMQPCVVGPDVTRLRPDTVLSAVVCPEGHRADIWTRVPEIPRDMLCSACLRMPDSDMHKMPPGVRFPSAYRSLQLGREEVEAHRVAYLQKRRLSLGTREVRVLTLWNLLDQGALDATMAGALGTGTLSHALNRLCRFGYVMKEDKQYGARWSYTDAGREKARELLAHPSATDRARKT
jgi:DNA-binding MarR family transcriptional regulator